jgi:hypothetical protein
MGKQYGAHLEMLSKRIKIKSHFKQKHLMFLVIKGSRQDVSLTH